MIRGKYGAAVELEGKERLTKIWSLVMIALAFTGTTSAAAQDAALIRFVDSTAADAVERELTAGISVGVKRGDAVIVSKGYGFADLENHVLATSETVYRIGSITKQFTAAAILRLAERGKLRLDDHLTKFMPDYPTQGYTVTVDHLLTHTSGIKSYTGLGPTFWDVAALELSSDELMIWQEALVEGRVINTESFDLMTTPARLNNDSATTTTAIRRPIRSGRYGCGGDNGRDRLVRHHR